MTPRKSGKGGVADTRAENKRTAEGEQPQYSKEQEKQEIQNCREKGGLGTRALERSCPTPE